MWKRDTWGGWGDLDTTGRSGRWLEIEGVPWAQNGGVRDGVVRNTLHVSVACPNDVCPGPMGAVPVRCVQELWTV